MPSEFDDDVLAVVAHSLLNSLAVIQGNAQTLAASWVRISESDRADLLERIVTQSDLVAGVLMDLVRSGRPEVVVALEELLPPT